MFKSARHLQANSSAVFNAFEIVAVLEDLWKEVLEDLTDSSETIRIYTQTFGKQATNYNETIGIFPKNSVTTLKKFETIPIKFLKPPFSPFTVECDAKDGRRSAENIPLVSRRSRDGAVVRALATFQCGQS